MFLMLPSDLIAALEAPGEYPGSCGSRNISENLSDLKAQVAANQKVGNCLCLNKQWQQSRLGFGFHISHFAVVMCGIVWEMFYVTLHKMI